MSKRYGRNQKRKARERIAHLEEQNAQLLSSSLSAQAEARKLNNQIRQWDEEIRRLLGRFSAFRAYPDNLFVDSLPERGQRMFIPPAMQPFADLYSPVDMIEQTFANLNLMIFEHREAEVALKQLMRTCFIDRGGRRVYALAYEIDGECFLDAIMGERERRYLAEQIAETMVHAARQKRAA